MATRTYLSSPTAIIMVESDGTVGSEQIAAIIPESWTDRVLAALRRTEGTHSPVKYRAERVSKVEHVGNEFRVTSIGSATFRNR